MGGSVRATLTIVRHGNTFASGETPRRIGARTDLPLVPGGVAQGEALARHFAGHPFDRMLASPLRRTRETAALILRGQADPAPIEPADWLAEIDHGPDEGQREEVILARIGHAALTRWDEGGIAPDGWIVDAERRIAAWRSVYADARGVVLLVTSNGAARFALMAHPALLAAARALPTMKLRTGAWGTITIDDDGAPALTDWNRRPG